MIYACIMLYVLLLGKGEEPELATQVQMCNSATVTMGSDFQSPNFPLEYAHQVVYTSASGREC